MPTEAHQLIILFLCDVLRAFVRPARLGKVLIAPFRIRLWEAKYRQPDVMFMRAENDARTSNEFWDGADLVMEVVSDDDRRRDLETKRFEYARAGIPEYWIVDPQRRHITVLKLDGQRYADHGTFADGDRATSALLPGLSVSVTEAFDAGSAA
jgi:Uma2 family endonuclease